MDCFVLSQGPEEAPKVLDPSVIVSPDIRLLVGGRESSLHHGTRHHGRISHFAPRLSFLSCVLSIGSFCVNVHTVYKFFEAGILSS